MDDLSNDDYDDDDNDACSYHLLPQVSSAYYIIVLIWSIFNDDDDNEDDVDFHSDCFSYNGIVVDPNERDSLAKDLGPNNKVREKLNYIKISTRQQ